MVILFVLKVSSNKKTEVKTSGYFSSMPQIYTHNSLWFYWMQFPSTIYILFFKIYFTCMTSKQMQSFNVISSFFRNKRNFKRNSKMIKITILDIIKFCKWWDTRQIHPLSCNNCVIIYYTSLHCKPILYFCYPPLKTDRDSSTAKRSAFGMSVTGPRRWQLYTDAPCHSRCGTLKIPQCSMVISAEHRSKFAALQRQSWRLQMSEKFSSGTKNSKQTNNQNRSIN